MLNGIGGRTVLEAKQNMPYDEFLNWITYRRQRGTLNLGMRLEWLFARAAYQNAGKNAKFEDIMRYDDEPEKEDRQATLSDLMRSIGMKK